MEVAAPEAVAPAEEVLGVAALEAVVLEAVVLEAAAPAVVVAPAAAVVGMAP